MQIIFPAKASSELEGLHFLSVRTGALLTFDSSGADPSANNEHFRTGTCIDLRASGSRQLDSEPYKARIREIADPCPAGAPLLVVDLRQECHLYFDGRAVSWYAEKDWSNVGQSLDWILADEQAKLTMVAKFPRMQIFQLKKAAEDRIDIVSQSWLEVREGQTEAQLLAAIGMGEKLKYVRVPVTDHCAPDWDSLKIFFDALHDMPAPAWVHFHCHGGDGRTTSFMAIYDMICWRRNHPDQPIPALECFSRRQQSLFSYDLDPMHADPLDWKYPLAVARWQCLDFLRGWIGCGGFERWPRSAV